MCITKNGVVRGKSWTRQTLSDAWESTNWEGLCGTPWQMVPPELKLTKKVTADKEGAGPPLPRIVVERAPEVEPRRFYVLSADIQANGQIGGCPGCASLASHGRATKPHNDECRERIRTIIGRTLTGKTRMNAYKHRIAETERVKERKRARVERGAGDVLMEVGNRADEQVAVRHADASGGDIRENQHEENRMRDIRVGKRGSEAASEEQPDKLRKTVQFEQEPPSASASSDPPVALEHPARGETQDRPGSVLVQKSGYVDDDVQIYALDAFYDIDGRKSRYIGEVLDRYRGEDAGILKRSELNELVGNLTCLNVLEGKIWKNNQKFVMDAKSWKIWKNNQNSVIKNEELVQNGEMNEKFVKNFVMNGKFDLKVVMDLSIFKIGGWNFFATHQSKIVGRLCS